MAENFTHQSISEYKILPLEMHQWTNKGSSVILDQGFSDDIVCILGFDCDLRNLTECSPNMLQLQVVYYPQPYPGRSLKTF